MADPDGTQAGSTGPGVDRHGNETIDPTKNVLDLVGAAILRQDDLRKGLRDEMKSQHEIIVERIKGMDRATELLSDNIKSIPLNHEKLVATQLRANQELSDARLLAINAMFAERMLLFDQKFLAVSEQVRGVEVIRDQKHSQLQHQLDLTVEVGVIEQRFDSITLQFLERDTRSTREAELNKIALDAAFAAQKESAAQQDLGNQKAIDKSEKATVDALAKLGELQKTTTDNLANAIADVKGRITIMEATRIGGSSAYTGIYAALASVVGILLVAVAVYAAMKP